MTIYQGTFIDTPTPQTFRVRENHFVLVEHGKVQAVAETLPAEYQNHPVVDWNQGFLIPSFTDLHVHAPQHMQMGAGLDLGLLDWLNQYTFPRESRFADQAYAQELYPYFAQDLLRSGSLRSVIYGTIHQESTQILAQELEKRGLMALVGKVNMDQNAPDSLRETTEDSLQATRDFCGALRGYKNIKAIITPRFAPTCTAELMSGLSLIAQEFDLPIQTHLGETLPEIQWVSELFPGSASYTAVYDDSGLLNKRSLMAHGIYFQPEELALIKAKEATLVHCPMANTNISSGVMPLGQYLDQGFRLGLGTDVGAGQGLSMALAITQAVQASKLLTVLRPEEGHRAVKLSEAFYLATVANGRFFAEQGMGACGSFDAGMSFDALHIITDAPASAALTAENQLERFLYNGDDRQIQGRILAGELLK